MVREDGSCSVGHVGRAPGFAAQTPRSANPLKNRPPKCQTVKQLPMCRYSYRSAIASPHSRLLLNGSNVLDIRKSGSSIMHRPTRRYSTT